MYFQVTGLTDDGGFGARDQPAQTKETSMTVFLKGVSSRHRLQEEQHSLFHCTGNFIKTSGIPSTRLKYYE